MTNTLGYSTRQRHPDVKIKALQIKNCIIVYITQMTETKITQYIADLKTTRD